VTCIFPCAHLNKILPEAFLTSPAALLVLRAVLLGLLVLASCLVIARSVRVNAATCLVREIDWSALVESIRNISGNHWGSIDLAAAGVDVAPGFVAPLRRITFQAVGMFAGIPCLAGAACRCWIFHYLALCNEGIHFTIAFVDTDAAAVSHAPGEAMEFLSALSKDFLPQALAT